jgi:REP element-mobilizing transposase RayT
MPDHCHLLVRLKPSIAPSKFIQAVKANSSAWINQKGFLPEKFNWQSGGSIFSIGHRHLQYLIQYIDNQKAHHAKISFRKEFTNLLDDFGIAFDQEYLLEFFD